jgi:hypothetical protein
MKTLALVVWGAAGTLGTSFGLRWSAAERALWTLNYVHPYLLGVIVGLIISDGSVFLDSRGTMLIYDLSNHLNISLISGRCFGFVPLCANQCSNFAIVRVGMLI